LENGTGYSQTGGLRRSRCKETHTGRYRAGASVAMDLRRRKGGGCRTEPSVVFVAPFPRCTKTPTDASVPLSARIGGAASSRRPLHVRKQAVDGYVHAWQCCDHDTSQCFVQDGGSELLMMCMCCVCVYLEGDGSASLGEKADDREAS
jgi:hypothetical protein